MFDSACLLVMCAMSVIMVGLGHDGCYFLAFLPWSMSILQAQHHYLRSVIRRLDGRWGGVIMLDHTWCVSSDILYWAATTVFIIQLRCTRGPQAGLCNLATSFSTHTHTHIGHVFRHDNLRLQMYTSAILYTWATLPNTTQDQASTDSWPNYTNLP